ncbi:MAG: type II toxin-antitoxin system RelE/ParE family toxin [Clostridiaceae bacterium]|jgi:mRNA interferase RelE/StbE|nr:type II toxin-antitoxin system RelE/ParE family toxin [Bacillota bacterium]NLP06819.1 type II toxin-antitoxin system RelE/ParE family toxin [Clostridiaceae bacterium]HOA56333.1 type II toxin-antitoxin system RelE/ParE family toxin [Clostridiales bacterium]HPZ05541.1 type II toxin-antitoxin system RelE/ParE family toxin [Clostridiales bacterium]HQD32054.1 type II toxin-antitoxin system RelE/ParE family toxin [Clostridiales bacterium]
MNQNYKIDISKNALKFINKQDTYQRKRILSAIYGLPKGDVKKLKGYEYYRLRVGDFRVIFTKNDKELIILVIDIGNRGQAYENL